MPPGQTQLKKLAQAELPWLISLAQLFSVHVVHALFCCAPVDAAICCSHEFSLAEPPLFPPPEHAATSANAETPPTTARSALIMESPSPSLAPRLLDWTSYHEHRCMEQAQKALAEPSPAKRIQV